MKNYEFCICLEDYELQKCIRLHILQKLYLNIVQASALEQIITNVDCAENLKIFLAFYYKT